MSDESRLERLEKMVDLIAEATIKGSQYAPVLPAPEVRELVRLRDELHRGKEADKRAEESNPDIPISGPLNPLASY